jgi:hypothetical protein
MDSDHHNRDEPAKPKNLAVELKITMDLDHHNQDGPLKPKDGCNSNVIMIKSNQEVKEKPKRKARKGFLKGAARNLSRLKAFRSISPVKFLCRCRDLYVQTMLSCRCAQADCTAFISPESGHRTRPVSLPADTSSNGSSSSSRRREEENLRRLIKMTESKSQLDDHQEFEFVNDHDEELMAMSAHAISTSIGVAFGIPRSSSVNNNSNSNYSWMSIAPIDEESPCYFPGSFKKRWATPLPRSASTSTTSNST